jgi:hypothetical protein
MKITLKRYQSSCLPADVNNMAIPHCFTDHIIRHPFPRTKNGETEARCMQEMKTRKSMSSLTNAKELNPYEKEFCTVFPRMWNSTESQYVSGYENWGKVKGTMINYNNGFSTEIIKKPKFSENLRFFFSYQIGHMYVRYFMWNFAGSQNDNQGHGNLVDGNWITGLNFIDNSLGPQDLFPENMKNNKARNKYYMLTTFTRNCRSCLSHKKKPKDAFVVMILFIMTGIAIVVYLNQTPYQPRERDYAYAASFYAFAIWIGLGVSALNQFFRKWLKEGNCLHPACSFHLRNCRSVCSGKRKLG